eukprot:NODE_348_length_919_cov_380.383838_g340_i0.p1 GENE.NODE_348_length_919_cov_380.383838_g340_i0~~NODE_348_length_919_cov_380.383838_g340_i0.p1  ORF type:complete len:230 (-),score=38.39 NODE_348_length_919_cov_380.383838_g340_i0:159-848(-)
MIFFLLAAILPSVFCIGDDFELAGLPHSPCDNMTYFKQLNDSTDMPASLGDMYVKIPYEVLAPFVFQVKYWTSWNPLFVRVNVSSIHLCGPFPADYSNAPVLPFPPGITGPHKIVQMNIGDTSAVVAWNFQIYKPNGQEITFGRHQMRFEQANGPSGPGFTLFRSYEKAAGSLVKPYTLAWTVALQQSLLDTEIGLSCLEQVYMRTGQLNPYSVAASCSQLPPVNITAV